MRARRVPSPLRARCFGLSEVLAIAKIRLKLRLRNDARPARQPISPAAALK